MYDVVLLGGGSAGIVAGVVLGGFGLRVLLIEKESLGGECLNTGCVPSKALLAAAKTAETIRAAGRFGLPSTSVSREQAAAVLARVREAIPRVRDADATEAMLRDRGVEIRYGNARFLSPDSLDLEGETLRAGHFVLCTGSRPRVPAIPGLDRVIALTNRNVFDLTEIPESLLVIGGGPVGVEMAQAIARLGSRVTLVQRAERILPRDDPELTRDLEGCLRDDGVEIHLGARVERFEEGPDASAVAGVRQSNGVAFTVPCRHVLVAAGRLPNVEGLALEAAGVKLTNDGVEVDSALHTTGSRVWACGDVLGRHRFSHMAEYEAKIVAQNLFLPIRRRARFRVAPWCTFTDPELASVGLTEAEARRESIPHLVLRQPFAQDDRALVEGEARGQVKIVVASGWRGTILGAQILGPRAGELIQEFTLAMEQGLGVRAIADSIHVYPTLSMAVQHAAQRWYERLEADPGVRKTLGAYRAARPAIPAVVRGAAVGAALGGVWWVVRKK